MRDLDTSRRQLDQFHQTDLPQFTRWLNTHFGTLQQNSHPVANPDHERLDSVVTQVLAGWTFTRRVDASNSGTSHQVISSASPSIRR